METLESAGGPPPGPVFVDQSGRRHKWAVRIGIALAALAAAYGVTLIVFALAGVDVDAPGLPFVEKVTRQHADDPADKGDPVPPTQTDAATSRPTDAPSSAVPQDGATSSVGTTPGAVSTRGATPTATAATTAPGKSGTAPGATQRATPTPKVKATGKPMAKPTTAQSGKPTARPTRTAHP